MRARTIIHVLATAPGSKGGVCSVHGSLPVKAGESMMRLKHCHLKCLQHEKLRACGDFTDAELAAQPQPSG